MTPEEITATQYRFSGYQFQMIQLDSTGPGYIVAQLHPYYRNQPLYWSKPSYQYNKPTLTIMDSPANTLPASPASDCMPNMIPL